MSSAAGVSSTSGAKHSMDLQRLEFLARDLISESLAPSTQRTYMSSQKRYLDYCRKFELSPFPLTESHLCTFVAHLMDEGLQHSSIKGYLSAIRHLQILKGMGDPFTASWPLLEYTLRGIKLRQAKHKDTKAKKRLPVTPDILRRLRSSWEKESHNPDFIMLRAACCSCFFGFLRSGEVTVPSVKEYDPQAHLSEGDVSLDNPINPTIVRVHIKASKTDPFHHGVYVYLGKTGNELCPVAAVAAYLAARGRVAGLFFRFVSGSPLSRELLVKHMRTALQPHGVDTSAYSGHSFHIGAATAAAVAGLEDSLVKTLGRWQSSAYQLYVRIPRESLAAVSKRLSET